MKGKLKKGSSFAGCIRYVTGKDGFQSLQQVNHIYMGLMETSLMRQLGKLVEVICHADKVLGNGNRLCVVSAHHLTIQG